jgi:hypothetical protein
MHTTPLVNVSIDETETTGSVGVDQSLLELARQLNGVVVSTDIGLVKVGHIRQVQVINLNDLANALKLNLLPGTHLAVELIRRGENEGQAVGYLEDGTMVVVDEAEQAIGSSVTVEVTSSLQTSAGRMIFAALPGTSAVRGHASQTEGGDQGASTPDAAAEQTSAPSAEPAGAERDAGPGQADPSEQAAAAERAEQSQRSTTGPLGPQRRPKRRAGNLRNPRREP